MTCNILTTFRKVSSSLSFSMFNVPWPLLWIKLIFLEICFNSYYLFHPKHFYLFRFLVRGLSDLTTNFTKQLFLHPNTEEYNLPHRPSRSFRRDTNNLMES